MKIYRPILRLQSTIKSSHHLNNLDRHTLCEEIHKLPQEIQNTFALNILDVKDIKLEKKDKDHVANTAYYPTNPITCKNPTFHDYLSRKKRDKHRGDYSGLGLSLLTFATQLLKHDIHVTYDEDPYVALYIYKHFHKNTALFNTIAAHILSNDPATIQSVGNSLLKILGDTLYKKMRYNPTICISLVNDFKTVLVNKTSYFVFPMLQIASRDPIDTHPTPKKNTQQLSYGRRFFHFNNQLMIRPLNQLPNDTMPTHKVYLCVNKDITAIYRTLDDTHYTAEGPMPFVTIYVDISNAKMILTSSPSDYNPLNINFCANYAIPIDRKSSTDDIINTLLKKSMKLKPWQCNPTVIKRLYETTETEETKKFIAWAYQNIINPISLKKMLKWLPWQAPTRNAEDDSQLWYAQQNNALFKVSLKQKDGTLKAEPLFWKNHHKSKQELDNYKHWLFIREDQFMIRQLEIPQSSPMQKTSDSFDNLTKYSSSNGIS